jgi:hypothetical protein
MTHNGILNQIILIALLIVFFVNFSFSQRTTSIQGQQINFNKFCNNLDRQKDKIIKESCGDFFLSEEWRDGIIYANSGVKIKNLKIRYCIYNQEIQFIKSQDTLCVSNPSLIDSIIFDQKNFIYTDFSSNDKIGMSYFEMLNSGNIKLLRKYDCKFIRGKSTFNSYQTTTNDKFVINETLFIKKDGEPAIKLPKKKSKFLNLMGNKKNIVDNYMKLNRIKLSKLDDVRKTLHFYFAN